MPKPEVRRAPSIGVRSSALRTLLPFGVEIVDVAAARDVAIDLVCCRDSGSDGVERRRRPSRCRRRPEALEQDLEGVARLDVALEIDVVAEDADHAPP